VVYGAKLNVKEGQKVEVGNQIAEWDPFAQPIIAEVPGIARFYDVVEGVTMNEQLDEVTGLSRKSIIESRDAEAQPRISIEDDKGGPRTCRAASSRPATTCRSAPTSTSTTATSSTRAKSSPASRARPPRPRTLQVACRRAELFEARKPKEHAVISEIEGVVSFGKDTKGKRKVVVTPRSTASCAPTWQGVPDRQGKHINVHAGDRVKAGDPLMDGAANPHDILKVLGEKELARYMVDEVQESTGCRRQINDKHIETIVRQMLPGCGCRTSATPTGWWTSRWRSRCSTRRTSGEGGRRQARGGRAVAARHHQGVSLD